LGVVLRCLATSGVDLIIGEDVADWLRRAVVLGDDDDESFLLARILKQPKRYLVWAGLLLVLCWAKLVGCVVGLGRTGKPGKPLSHLFSFPFSFLFLFPGFYLLFGFKFEFWFCFAGSKTFEYQYNLITMLTV
jgi:hypothetical protein